ncbi:hypothetical protein ABFT23_05420 [Nocardioides sp. C4-1]|uniref:hypothetical protein n=1 Tax=Nocardioides sp. C4-1 TaxID=3151851 RepID=UPI0032641352
MSALARIGAFAVALVAVFVVALGVGRATGPVGPVGPLDEPTTSPHDGVVETRDGGVDDHAGDEQHDH